MEQKPLALKTTLKELLNKYETLYPYALVKSPETAETFKEFLDDLKKLDAICIERNRY